MEPSPAPDPYEAAGFELQGEGIQLRYVEAHGADPERRMTLILADGHRRAFRGDDIHVDRTEAGRLASVVVDAAPDSHTTWLSIVLPGVNLSREQTAEITTVALRTVHRTSIGGAELVDGALSSSTAVALTGTATSGSSSPRWSCDAWEAWYDDEPGPDARDDRLHVTAHCTFASGSITWKLEPGNEGVVDDPERFVLQFTVDDPGAGTDDFVETTIDWVGDAGPDIKVVELRGDANLEIAVKRVT